MFELRPFERRNNHAAAYDPWDQMERAFFGDGSWGRGLSEFKTDIQGKRSVDSIHKELGHILWEHVGMGRTKEGLEYEAIKVQTRNYKN